MSDIYADLRRDEGDVPYAYQDSRGYWTIGVGFLIDRRLGAKLPTAVRDFWLNYLINEARAELDRELPWWITRPDDAQCAMLNMVYNLGIGRFMGFKKMISCLQMGDYEGAAKHALDSKWAEQVPSRAHRIAAMYRNCATTGVTS